MPNSIGGPADPTDPQAQQQTIDHLRALIEEHDQESSGASPTPQHAEKKVTSTSTSGKKPDPQTHQEWVDFGREVALRQLGFSDRSSEQLRDAMRKREVPEGAVHEVVERLTRVGLIDDAAYAAMLVRTRQAERGLARRALLEELRKKGIPPHIAEEAIEQVDEADEAVAARELVRKRVRSMRDLDPTRRRNRLYGTLGRKGYTSSTARQAIDEVLTEEGLPLY